MPLQLERGLRSYLDSLCKERFIRCHIGFSLLFKRYLVIFQRLRLEFVLIYQDAHYYGVALPYGRVAGLLDAL